jgi:hypothetical protein
MKMYEKSKPRNSTALGVQRESVQSKGVDSVSQKKIIENMTQGVSPISLTLTGACRVYLAQEEPSANDQSALRLANLLFDQLRRRRPVHTESNRAITVTEKEWKQSRRWNNCVPDRFWHNSVQRWTNQNKGPQRIQWDALTTQNWSN